MIQKLILVLLVAVAAVVMVPSLRAKVWPKVQPALYPLYEWNAKNRVNEIRELVKRADAQGHSVPGGASFPQFVDNEDMQQNASQDPWGNPYYIVFTGGTTFQVGSAGRDGEAGTGDDILSNPDEVSHAPDRRR